MANGVEKSRNGCALHGAINSISEIEGIIPIVHSTAGCSIQQNYRNRLSILNGFQIPSTNIIEKQVVFGGGSRLREQIKNTIKVIKADLYVTLSGCTSELVGDDVITMANEAKEQGEPVIYYKSPGFKGKYQSGYEGVVNAIINQLPGVKNINTEKDEKLINIFGIIPYQDINWRGNLAEIKRILEALGYKVNTLFGIGQNISNWQDIPKAVLNISFSKWSESVVENLNEKYKTPYIKYEYTPIGALETIDFIEELSKEINIDENLKAEFINDEKNQENYYLKNLLNIYIDNNFQKEVAVVGNESTVKAISEFLSETLGFIVKAKIFTDPIREENEKLSEDEYRTEDLNEIEEIIKENDIEFILGSSLEKSIAKELNIPIQVISFPEKDKVILNKSYAGFLGGISFIEDLSSTILSYEKNKENQDYEEVKSLRR